MSIRFGSLVNPIASRPVGFGDPDTTKVAGSFRMAGDPGAIHFSESASSRPSDVG